MLFNMLLSSINQLIRLNFTILQIKSVQKAARSLNTLCAEGKVRGDMNVVIRVSRLKKAIETFINESYLLLRHRAPEMVVEFGELKHRDLQGHALATSQMFPAMEEDHAMEGEEEEEGEGDEEMEDGEEEDESDE